MLGEKGDDNLYGSLQDDRLRGGEGNDNLYSGGGDNELGAGLFRNIEIDGKTIKHYDEVGIDVFVAEGSQDTIYAGDGGDTIKLK